MKRKNILLLTALILAFSLVLCACGAGKEDNSAASADTPAASDGSLGLAEWNLSTTTWSSPNGATVHLTATPTGYTEGQSAQFCVRLEGEDVDSTACEWNGSTYTAFLELNAADGYCYYVILTAADGTQTEVAVNTPAEPRDEALINMASALESYCNILVEDSSFAAGKLTITKGTAQVQAPTITNDGSPITCNSASLVLLFNDQESTRTELTLSAAEVPGSYTADLKDISFAVPAMEDDQQLSLTLEVTLSNGQTLSAPGGTWFYNDNNLLSAVG